MSVVTVHARQAVKCLSDKQDEGVAGKYRIKITDGVPEGHVAGVALDVFHSSVAVGCLDDFEFAVRQGRKALVEGDGYVSYSGEGKGEMLG